jgi:hypothetical protein
MSQDCDVQVLYLWGTEWRDAPIWYGKTKIETFDSSPMEDKRYRRAEAMQCVVLGAVEIGRG